jgi:hypothetical protein
MKRLLLLLALLVAPLLPASAQLSVDLQVKRRMYMRHEPILATVVVTNRTGRDILLADTEEGGPWFSFQISAGSEGRTVPPRNPNYELTPLPIPAGQSVKRTVNLNELYAIDEFGTYKVRGSIFFSEAGKYFGSKPDVIVITEGRVVWKQTVGSPDGSGNRTYSLLTLHHEDKGKMLYVRIEGQDEGTVYGCYNLGHLVDGIPPDVKLDSGNNLAVLHLTGNKTYLLSRISTNGSFISQNLYVTPKSRPFLRVNAGGELQIVGAVRQQESIAQALPADAPKLSDRPAGLPKLK